MQSRPVAGDIHDHHVAILPPEDEALPPTWTTMWIVGDAGTVVTASGLGSGLGIEIGTDDAAPAGASTASWCAAGPRGLLIMRP
jgi:hypothetical protein